MEVVLFEGTVQDRKDIDAMEATIRNIRETILSTSTLSSVLHSTRRCNILETSAYLRIRNLLLHHLFTMREVPPACMQKRKDTHGGMQAEDLDPGSAPKKGKKKMPDQGKEMSDQGKEMPDQGKKTMQTFCHIGGGISIFHTISPNTYPTVKVVWRHTKP